MSKAAPRNVSSKMDTLLLTRDEILAWQVPEFQRPIRVNEKVRALAELLKTNGGIIPGVVTLGKVSGDKTTYLTDGQHRREGFIIADLPECIVDVRITEHESIADMAKEFVLLNSRLVNMRPDDLLHGMEANIKSLRMIREACDFVGYDQIRRVAGSGPILSMSIVLRCWVGAMTDTPRLGRTGKSALNLAQELCTRETQELIKFLQVARTAWGIDPEYYRLWGALNLTITMWIWRRMVLDMERRTTRRFMTLGPEQFSKCMMATTADATYLDWLQGRSMNERDRSPCFIRLRSIYVRRIAADSKADKKVVFIQPAWASKVSRVGYKMQKDA